MIISFCLGKSGYSLHLMNKLTIKKNIHLSGAEPYRHLKYDEAAS